MLKKIIVGLLCFIILGVTGIGIYIYTLDWNKHKAIVAQRFSQITGLKAVIDGNLTVDLFPTPKFSAGMVKFTKNNARVSLVEVDDISANVDLMPLLNNKFILSSMSLTGATIHLVVSEKGELNWSGVRSGGKNKSGNIEVAFNDVRMTRSVVSYENKKDNKKFEIPNISANISANSLEGPYKTNGKFIHNNSEVSFSGDVVIDNDVVLKMTVNNASTASKLNIDGSFGKKAKGNVSFDTKSLYDIVSVVFGENTISETYDSSLFVSFVYDYEKNLTKLDNFSTKYGNNTAGSGVVKVKKAEKWNFDADLEMLQFDLGILEDISKDIIKKETAQKEQANENSESKPSENTQASISVPNYDLKLNIQSNYAKYKNVDAQKLTLGLGYSDGVISLDRFSVVMPGESAIKSVGKVSLLPKINYAFNQTFESKDLRIFASIFGLDVAKYTLPDNKKHVFKNTQAEFMLSGDLDALKISIPRAQVDSTSFNGNLGFIFKEDKNYVLAQFEASKIIFDKYFQTNPSSLSKAGMEEKFVYQMNMAPWKGNFETDATISIGSAVYKKIPIEKLDIHFVADDTKLDVKKFSAENFAGANVNMVLNIDNPYTKPYFNELSYDVKTDNFPIFASAIGVNTNSKDLFKRKIFATQGALSGRFDEFSLSSIQKFGDVEFSYTGVVAQTKEKATSVKGNIELKTNNFVNFAKSIGLDYNPDIALTTFTMSSQIEGIYNLFELKGISAYLGANNIVGTIKLDRTQNKPNLFANLAFDKFDVNRMFGFTKPEKKKDAQVAFIAKPNFESDKYDFSSLNKINFNIDASVKQLLWNNEAYNNFVYKGTLKDGILNVNDVNAIKGDSKINLNLALNSNGVAKIDGKFNVEGYTTPAIGGNIYRIENGFIDADGSFSSVATSKKEFLDNLNSKGRFRLYSTAMSGWDLDIIKFELEQRKSVQGFSDTVLNSLKTGKSSFDEIKGRYEVKNGVIVSDNIVWSSPVINMNMIMDANLSDWKFNSDFNAFYKNASFSDVLKFNFSGSIDSPVVKPDLSDSIARISEIEKVIVQAEQDKEKEKTLLLKGKIDLLQKEIKTSLQDISRMSLDVIRFKPVTQNENVKRVYESNIKELKEAEKKLKELEKNIVNAKDEKVLMDLEAKLAKETSRFKFVPKILEENYVVDSKYLFDDTFNKITWLFNLAQNNSSYYNSLTEVYLAQIDILATTETPVSESKTTQIDVDMKNIAKEIDRISKLHAKIRDNYLTIIDSTSVSDMKENNELAEQALTTMFTYVKELNNNLIDSIDVFRAALGINARDYDLYMVHPPRSIEEIDITKPTTKLSEKEALKANEEAKIEEKSLDEGAKKKDNLALSLEGLNEGVASLIGKFNAKKNASEISLIEFSGLSNTLKPQKNMEVAKVESLPIIKDSKAEISSNEIKEVKTVEKQPLGDAVSNENKKDEVLEVAENNIVLAKDLEKIPAVWNNVIEDEKIDEKGKEETKIDVLENTEIVIAQKTEAKKTKEDTKLKETPTTSLLATNLINKTKNAISGLISKITKPQKEIELKPLEPKEIKLATIDENNTKVEEVLEVKDDKITDVKTKEAKTDAKALSSVNEKTPLLKVNPVIAMDIGKNNDNMIDEKIALSIEKKKGFKKQENELKDNDFLIVKPSRKTLSKDELDNIIIKAETKQNVANKDIIDTSFATVGFYDELKNHDVENENSYVVLNIKANKTLSGEIGKSFTNKTISSDKGVSANKYLFAKKNINSPKTMGEIGKKFALSVK